MSRHLLQPQHSPPFWLIKFSSRSNWSNWLSDYQAITWCIYIPYPLPLIYLILLNLFAGKNNSMIFQGYVEQLNSKVPHFNFSIPCPVWTPISFTSHLMSLNFIILSFTADTAKFLAGKENYGKFPYLPRHFTKVCLVFSMASINKQKSSLTS